MSRIFSEYRVLGFVSNHVPLTVRYVQRRREHLICTVVGKSFHTYGSYKLRLLSVSNPHPDDISYITSNDHLVFTACKNVIRGWRRGNELRHTYVGHESDVHLLLPYGPYLISVDEKSSLKIWHIKDEEVALEIIFDNETFRITAVLHPNTYVNKILVGSEQGRLQLWNTNTSKLVYTFRGWDSAVVAMEQAPAVDVVAIGLASGEIIIQNLKFDETVMKFNQEWGPAIAISFRLDGKPIMATSTVNGHVLLWDLEKKILSNQLRKAHRGAVTGLRFLPSEPILVTSSSDNSLKMWIFDQMDDNGRILKFKDGHSAPPSKIGFYGNEGYILSVGQDSTMRMMSAVADILNKSLGQASFNRKAAVRKGVSKDTKKMPAITSFAAEQTREKEWDNVICCHRGLCEVTTWSTYLCKMGNHKLMHERFLSSSFYKKVVANCVSISSCGNFVLIGYSSGHVDMFNIQSGLFRGQYGNPKAHEEAVQGVKSDDLNQLAITGSSDATVKFWNFKSKNLIDTVKLVSGVAQFKLRRNSDLLTLVLDNFSICLIDIHTRKIVRVFCSYLNRITDLTYSPDSRLLITSSMDCSIRTWDIPSAQLVDHFLLESACTSLDMSPTGDYLATTHVDNLGIYLWTNRTLYYHVTLQPLPSDYEPLTVMLTDNVFEEPLEDEDKETNYEFKSPAQISDELVTLSLLPHSRWHNLLLLDIIKERNKPKLPPKPQKSAPFFIPTVAGLEFKFAPDDDNDDEEQKNSKIIRVKNIHTYSEFGKFLVNSNDYKEVMNRLKAMGPSSVDAELRCLSPEYGGSRDLVEQFLNSILKAFQSNQDFEAAQAYFALFLKLHWDYLSTDSEFTVSLHELSTLQKQTWERIQKEFNQCLCLLNFYKNPAL